MALNHLRWESHGRTFYHDDDPNRKVFKTFIRQQNIDIGGGEYAPYVWDDASQSIRYAEHLIEFHDWYQVIKQHDTGEILIDDQRFELQKWRTQGGGSWRVVDLWQREIFVDQRDDHCIITKRLFDGGGNDLSISFRIVPNEKVNLTLVLTVADAGTYRIRFQNTGISGEVTERQYRDGDGNDIGLGKILFEKIWFAWSKDEIDIHSYTSETQAGGKKIDIFMGSFDLATGESITISPDTWGPAHITASGDDVGYDDSATFATDHDEAQPGIHGGNLGFMIWRFANVTVAQGSTINAGTFLECFNLETDDQIALRHKCVDQDDVTQAQIDTEAECDALDLTDAQCDTNIDYPNDTGYIRHPALGDDLDDEIQEVISRGGWSSGNALAVKQYYNGVDTWTDAAKFTASDGVFELSSKLTIDYTEGAAEYSLVCDGGSFSLAGIATALLKSSVIVPDPGSFVFTGMAATVGRLLTLDAGVGAYVLGGQVVALLKSGKIDIETASYILTGQDITLTKGRAIDIGAGSYILTGFDVDLIYTPGEGVYIPTYRPRRR